MTTITTGKLDRDHTAGKVSDDLRDAIQQQPMQGEAHTLTDELQARLNEEGQAWHRSQPAPPLAARVLHAAESVVQTRIARRHRVNDSTLAARLAVCRECPSSVVVLTRGGEPYRCGRMLGQAKAEGQKTCGCVLSLKARDNRQSCPNGHWKE